MLAKLLRRLYHACWYIIAAIVVSAAVSVTVARLALPGIDNYREDIQNWISSQAGYSISTTQIEAEWQGWTPYLYLHNIKVLDQSGKKTLTTLKSATISLNPLTTLFRQRLSPLRITITGPELLVIRNLDGAINIAQPENDAEDTYQQDKNSAFAEWLLQQRSVSIKEAKISYIDLGKHNEPVQLSDVSVLFKRFWRHIQIDVSAKLPEAYGDTFSLSLDAQGNISTPQWSGHVYFSGNDIYPGKLFTLAGNETTSAKLNTSPVDIQLWSNWKDGKLGKVDGHIDASDIQFEYGQLNYHVQHLDTLFTLVSNGNKGFKLRAAIEDLVTENGVWPKTNVEFHKQYISENDFHYTSRFDYLKIEDALPLLRAISPDTGFISDSNISLQGTLLNTLLIFDNSLPEPVYIDSDIQDLSIRHDGNNSIISSLDGHIAGTLTEGLINLNTDYLELVLPDMFENRLAIYELSGDINWRNDKGTLIFETSQIGAHTPHFNSLLTGKMTYTPENSIVSTNLFFNASDLDLENVPYYMPLSIPEDVHAWVKNSLISGQVSSLDITLRGNLSDFPFRNMEGQFKTIANIHNATMDYHPDWTPVDKLDAELIIDNNRLIIDAHGGNIYNAEITEALAVVEELDGEKNSMVINGHMKGSTADALFIINNSPLASSEMLKQITEHEISGPLALDLNFDIPFDHEPMSLTGDLFFDKASLKSPALGFELANITGNILFTRDTVSTRKLSADYFNQQVDLEINTDEQDRLMMGLSGISNGNFIAEQLSYFFPDLKPAAARLAEYLDGACNWNATLTPDTTQSSILTITSDLAGLAIDLPAPAGKKYGVMPLVLTTTISDAPQKEIRITLGDFISGNMIVNQNGEMTLSRAELALGSDTKLFNDGEGIFIYGVTDKLSLSDWYDFIDSLDIELADEPTDKIQIDLLTSSLEYYGQSFADTRFSLNNLQSDLQINIDGPDIKGEMTVTGNTNNHGVKASFEKLHLQNISNSEQDSGIDPREQAPLELTVEEFSYGAINLGKLLLNTSKAENGISIDTISFEKPGLTINGKGTWQIINDAEFSNFDFSLSSTHLETMLTTFDYSVAPIKDGATEVNLTATWGGSPMDFSLPKVNGTLEMNIKKGEFMNIEPAAGRLFGLLSLQTLPRRLSLDFSDLFSKGFSFDQIDGVFSIESGDAYTNNLIMTGPSADIEVTGRTGLTNKDYDQIVTITPQVSDSLPVASALFGPIGIGVGAVLFLAGELFQSIPKQIDKLLRYQYTIKGNWEDPLVEKYKGEAEGSG